MGTNGSKGGELEKPFGKSVSFAEKYAKLTEAVDTSDTLAILINLDPDLRMHLLQLIRAYAEEASATLVYVTHSRNEAELVGGRVIRMERGRIVA